MKIFGETKNSKSNFWLQTILLNKPNNILKKKIIEITNKNGIQTRPVWRLLHKLKHFKIYPKMDLKISEKLEKRIINIPSSSQLIK